MSGIVAIIHTDASPVDRSMLRQMTDYMAFRGPDAQETWATGHVGFGHAMLKTTFEAEREQQPCSLDDQVWITADCRVDGRKDLIRELKSRGRDVCELATDVELILHAYHTWDTDCVKHLIGDFSFVIWDGRQRRIFCARDHFGVKPLYFAQVGHSLIISNTLNVIRMHPEVSDELNDLAIADFLLFGYNQEPETTSFADIQRVPPAHTLTWAQEMGPARRERYWTLPIDGCIRYKKTQDYVEHFKTLFWQAVGDRLRTDKVGVFMSGGLDSTSVAAAAKAFLEKTGIPYSFRGLTFVYDSLIPDCEHEFTRVAAETIGIPVQFQPVDRYTLFDSLDMRESSLPEPFDEPMPAIYNDGARELASTCRVALTGQGGDPLLLPHRSYFSVLLRNRQLIRFGSDTVSHLRAYGTIPRLGLRQAIRAFTRGPNRQPNSPPLPLPLDGELLSRLNLSDRWNNSFTSQPELHTTRPDAYAALNSMWWGTMFEQFDNEWVPEQLEVRHPLVDLRLVELVLAYPNVPFFLNKSVLRMAMVGHLPPAVLRRPKTPLQSNPVLARLVNGDTGWLPNLTSSHRITSYVDISSVRNSLCERIQNRQDPSAELRACALSLWLEKSFDTNPKDRRRCKNEYAYS